MKLSTWVASSITPGRKGLGPNTVVNGHVQRWRGRWGGVGRELKDGTEGYGAFSGEVRKGTDLDRQREEEDGSPLDEGTNRNRGFGTNMAMAQLGEKEDRLVRRGHYLHSQTSWHFTGQRKGRAVTCPEYLRASGKALPLVLFNLHNSLRRWELGPISQVRKLRPRNTKNRMQGSRY